MSALTVYSEYSASTKSVVGGRRSAALVSTSSKYLVLPVVLRVSYICHTVYAYVIYDIYVMVCHES